MPRRSTEAPRKKSSKKRHSKRPTKKRSPSTSSESSDDADNYTPEQISHLSSLMDSIVDDDSWEAIGDYVDSISVTLLTLSLRHRNELDSTPLHSACRFNPPPELLQTLIAAAPEMILWSDSFGWLPLHYAAANGASEEVAALLLKSFPGAAVEVDKRNRTPLHFALCNVNHPISDEMTSLLLKPVDGVSACSIPDENSMLPIHYACAYGSSEEVLSLIIEGYDTGVTQLDFKGRTPLHFVMGNSDRENSVQVMKMLVEYIEMFDSTDTWHDNEQKHECMVNIIDYENNLPLHLLSKKAKDITKQEKELRSAPTMTDDGIQDFELHAQYSSLIMSKERVRKCLDLYLSTEPETTSMFLDAIQFLPGWIRDEAVLHPTIQHMLNDRISHRFPTMILVMDFYVIVGVIVSFTLVSLQSAELRADDANDTTESKAVESPLIMVLYWGAGYFMLREISQMISIKIQQGLWAYFKDWENAVNLSFIFLTFIFAMVIENGWGTDATFHQGSALTIGAQYLQVLVYLRTVFVQFAVFVSGVIHVVFNLGAFSMIFGITIMAFSQMWYTVFRGTELCLNDENGTEITDILDDGIFQYYDDGFFMPEPEEVEDCEPHMDYPYCESLWWSIYKTFSMSFGLGDGLLELSPMSMFLSITWLFLVLLMILNLLIGIICDLFGSATDEQAAIVFWTKRLAFVTDMDWILRGPWRKKVAKLFRCKKIEQELSGETSFILPSKSKDTVYRSRKIWARLIRSFDPSLDNSFRTFVMRIIVWFFIIPAWVILGLVTAGWFWPPQLREGLMKEDVFVKEESPDVERFESLKMTNKNLINAKNEIVQQFVVDRKSMKRVKERTRTARKELKEELRNMKGVMTSLYEVQQQIMS